MASSRTSPGFFTILLRSLLVLLLSLPVILLLLTLQSTPQVAANESLNQREIARVEQFLLNSAPRAPASPGRQHVWIDVDDLNLLLRGGIDMTSLAPDWAARAQMETDRLNLELSIRVLGRWVPLYLNAGGEFLATDNGLTLDGLRLGRLQVPERMLRFATGQLGANLQVANTTLRNFGELLGKVERLRIGRTGMEATLQWDPVLIGRISDDVQQLFQTDADREHIIAHYQMISDISTTIPTDTRAVSLNTFLAPLSDAARERSEGGSDPVAENRTLFQTLAVYVNGEDLSRLVGPELAASVQPAKPIEVRLQRRQDLAQHLVSIAAITAFAGADFARLLSTTKEAYDARYRSGFSFSDLTANSVGVTLGRLSTQDAETALIMQTRLAALQDESDYMPAVGNNRDGISESAFNALYSDRNSARYRERLREIDELIRARPLFLGLL